jgi:hypothetical protein
MPKFDFKVNQGADLTVPFLLLDESGGGLISLDIRRQCKSEAEFIQQKLLIL